VKEEVPGMEGVEERVAEPPAEGTTTPPLLCRVRFLELRLGEASHSTV
jgi:hypothetical protein